MPQNPMPQNTSGCSVLLLATIAVLGLVLLPSLAHAQLGPGISRLDTSRLDTASVGPPSITRSVSLPRPPSAPLPSDDEGVQFDRALAGSAMGAAVGGLLGAAIIAAAEPEHRAPYENDENNDPESFGLLLIGGGAPVGAVLNTRIPRDHEGAYIMAVLGELVVGGAGAALGMRLGDSSDRGRLIGGLALGGAGVIFGAAGGAVLAAPDGPGGALSYENGSWRAQSPTVQVGVHRSPRLGLHGTVSLVSVEL